ncbi:MAG: MurR/RpiR family transcriptional regulator [Eubacteriales bacterium]|nr:MurR/RpiR family transcriptional regulator [Eubacteriales bacterium]
MNGQKTTDLLKIIQEKQNTFSKGQKQISSFILAHYDKAAYMTAAKLGALVGVSESTVVRFANELGFAGYPELQHSLQEMIRSKLTTIQRIEITNDRIGESDLLEKVLNSDIDKIKHTLDEIDRTSFENAVDDLIGAQMIYIIGMRSSSSLASFMYHYLNLVFPHVRLVRTTSGSEIFEQLLRINDKDAIVGISFPRYSKRIINALGYAKKQGAKVISITDSAASPIAANADDLLLAKSDMASFVDSLVAPLSIINALIVAIGRKKQDEIAETFGKLERIWDEYDVYEKPNSFAPDKNGDGE